jgi:Transposase DDE domain
MPTLVWLYLTALLYDRTSASCVALAEALPTVSRDRLTSVWRGDWSGHTRLELAWRTLFVCARGDLIMDDTVIPQPSATAIEGLAWVYSSQERKPVSGFALVLLVWTAGTVRLPLGLRCWHKGGPSQYVLALAWLSSARNRLRCRPDDVLFDAWSPPRSLLKRIRDHGWDFVCRPKRNRRFNGHAVRQHRRPPYRTETGWLSGGLKVRVVRYGKRYYATNRLSLAAVEVRRLYRVRAQIEELIRVCKDHLGLARCQARSAGAQQHHIACCLSAFCVLERERHDRQLSIYQLKRQLSFKGRSLALPSLERLRHAA